MRTALTSLGSATACKEADDPASIAQDPIYARMFDVLRRAVNPTITGLALRLAFHDAASYDPNGQPKGG